MLATGPLRQWCADGVEIWNLLHELPDFAEVTFIHIFSHVDFAPHDAVDKEAKEALEDEIVPIPVPLRDARRFTVYEDIKEARENLVNPNPATIRSVIFDQEAPPDFGETRETALNLRPCFARRIFRLWTGVSPTLGGWRHRFEDPCPACGTMLTRSTGQSAVVHAAVCPELAALRLEIFGEEEIKAELFWTNLKQTLTYLREIELLSE